MGEDQTYNGWSGHGTRISAYATWRVALELFDDDGAVCDSYDEEPTVEQLADCLVEYAAEYVDSLLPPSNVILRGWIDAFLGDVNYDEIAESMIATWWPKEEPE